VERRERDRGQRGEGREIGDRVERRERDRGQSGEEGWRTVLDCCLL
jgi:hypothetical protein